MHNGDEYFFCGLCKSDNKLGKKGELSIKQHIATAAHKNAKKACNSVAPMKLFTTTGPTRNELGKCRIVEATVAYQIIKHHQSFASADCTNETFPSKSKINHFMHNKIINAFIILIQNFSLIQRFVSSTVWVIQRRELLFVVY